MSRRSEDAIMRTMAVIVLVAAPLALLTAGCSNTYYIRSLDSAERRAFDERASEKPCEVVLSDGTKRSARNVTLSEDTTRWYAAKTGEEIRVSTQRIESIVFRYHGSGLIQGAGLGFAIAGGFGAVLGLSAGEDDCSDSSALLCFRRDEMMVILTAVLGVPGAVVGGIAGLIRGTKYVYHPFPEQSEDEYDRAGRGVQGDGGTARQPRRPGDPSGEEVREARSAPVRHTPGPE